MPALLHVPDRNVADVIFVGAACRRGGERDVAPCGDALDEVEGLFAATRQKSREGEHIDLVVVEQLAVDGVAAAAAGHVAAVLEVGAAFVQRR